MFGVKVIITKFIDSSQPGWVQCKFTDAFGEPHIFNEKVPIVTTEYLDEKSSYPKNGIIGCEIIERNNAESGEIIKIDTDKYSLLESRKGETIFKVFKEQIIEF